MDRRSSFNGGGNGNNSGSLEGESIVNKIQGALNTYRHDLDNLNRKKKTASERLRLAKEEKEFLSKKTKKMETKLLELKNDIIATTKEIQTLQEDDQKFMVEVRSYVVSGIGFNSFVSHSNRLLLTFCYFPSVHQMTFQRNELLSSRTKIKHLNEKNSHEAREREWIHNDTMKRLHVQREKVSEQKHRLCNALPNLKVYEVKSYQDAQIEQFKKFIEDPVMKQHVLSRLQYNIDQKASILEQQLSNLIRARESLELEIGQLVRAGGGGDATSTTNGKVDKTMTDVQSVVANNDTEMSDASNHEAGTARWV